MSMASRKDPYAGFMFLVEVGGLVVGGFSEVSGINAETEVEEYREGGVNDYVHRLPKITKYPNLILKRGITDSDTLWKWYRNVAAGKVERKNGSVILLDYAGNEKWRWNFSQAYPVKWSGPDLKADNSLVAVETLELAHNGLTQG
ncbi:MAG: phage tail protein [Firmicutes bacterium HGW-Firmicutes-14]|nr:MAG: phage tail protein [Firmicutes bacterium HGW-Firmicutes-14]